MRATDIYNFSDEAKGVKDAISQLKDAVNVARYSVMRGDDKHSQKAKLAQVLLDDIEKLIADMEDL